MNTTTKQNMLKGPLNQLGVGISLGLAVSAGIEGRSWGAFFGIASIAAFFFAISAGVQASRSNREAIRVAGKSVLIACTLLFIGIVLSEIERLYLVNGTTYPRVLARDLGAANYATLDKLRADQCKGQTMEIYSKADNLWVIRCGFGWYEGHTYISSTDPYADVLGQPATSNTTKGAKQ